MCESQTMCAPGCILVCYIKSVMNIRTKSERVTLVPIFYFIKIIHPLHRSSFSAKTHAVPALFACKQLIALRLAANFLRGGATVICGIHFVA